jgi:hypothetical protein
VGPGPVAPDGDRLTARAIRYDRSGAALFTLGRADDQERGLPWRDLTGHAPIDHVAALMRLPA